MRAPARTLRCRHCRRCVGTDSLQAGTSRTKGCVVDVQEAKFDVFASAPSVRFTAQKWASAIQAEVSTVVLASNVEGFYKDRDADLDWRAGGLSLDSPVVVSCEPPPACMNATSPCRTIWLVWAAASCNDAPLVNVTVGNSSKFTRSTAQMSLRLRAAAPAEGTFSFTVFFPLTNFTTYPTFPGGWTYQSLPGAFSVIAVADAAQCLIASLCQGSDCPLVSSAQFNSTNNGAAPVEVTIVAKDVDGFAILRGGERITVVLRSAAAAGGGAGVQAEYDPTAQRYRASFAELTTAGSYSISVQTPKGTSERATFTLVCAAGYAPADGGRCMQPRSPCETAVRSSVASTSSLQALVVGDGFQVSNLGSACRDGRCSLGVAPFSKTMASVAVSNGQGAVRFNQTGQFEVRIMYGEGQQCTLPGAHAVACPKDRPIYSTEQGGTCVAQGSPCLDMNVTASGADARPGGDSALFTAGTRLSMSFPRSSQFFGSAASMEALLVPAEGTQVQMVTQDMLLSKPGGYTLQLRYDSGRQQCIRLSNLTVACGVNEQALSGQCVSTQTLC